MKKLLVTLLTLLTLCEAALADVGVRGDTGNKMKVDANGNANVTLPGTSTQAGYARLAGDDTSAYGVEVPSTRRLLVGQDSIQFYDGMEGSAVNGGLWTAPVTTFTVAQANGFIVLNNTGVTTANAVARISSVPNMRFLGRVPLMISMRMKMENLCVTNVTAEWGWGTAATTAAPTDGAYFRCNPNGQFRAYLNFGGVETPSAVLATPSNGNVHKFKIVVYHDDVHFYVDDVQVADLDVPVDAANPTLSDHLPIFVRLYNGASTPAVAPKIHVAQVVAMQIGLQQSDVAMQGGFFQKVGVNPTTYAQLGRVDHSTTNQTLTSNTAPAATNLGGDFIFAAPLAATTEFPMFSVQVPTGFRFVMTGVHITAVSYGAAVTTTPTVLQWYAGTGDTATSLATTDGADFVTLAVRRVPLATQIFPVSTAIGAGASDDIPMRTPLVVESGRYVHIILSVPVGTATASQVIRGTVFINGYFE